jgi:WD40 repeat protein
VEADMIGTRRVVGRLILAKGHAVALGLLLALAASAPSAFAEDAAGTSREDVSSLQRRLTDAGCYNGAIDGAAGGALDAAVMACPDQAPLLRIETGMHTATIRRIGVDASCSRIATASDDKTVRLWSLPDGRLERTIRLPIGVGNDGQLNAVALSPDGRRFAAGGNSSAYAKVGSSGLSFVDLDSGSIRRVGSFPDVIDTIGFSPDGARVAVGLAAKGGVRVYDWMSGEELLTDRDYAGDVYGLAFAADGALIATSWDGQLRRYGPDFRLSAKRGSLAGQRPYGVAIDPAGQRLAVGFGDSPKVSILDATTLATIAEANADVTGNLGLESVAWSRDGGMLVAGGRASFNLGLHFLRHFDPNGRRRGADIPISSNTVMDLRPCGEGFAYSAADPAFGLASAGGMVKLLQGPRTADTRNKLGKGLQISGDGAIVRFGLGNSDDKPVLFDVAAGSLANSPIAPASLAPARVDGLPVTDWKNSYEPKFKDIKIGLGNYELARSLAVRPDGSGFALGTEWSVRAFDATGKSIWKRLSGPGIARGIDFSADGQILVVFYGDGTIRWLRGTDGVELLALFVDVPTRRWVAWTPTGYYMASPGGENLIGWHLNRGWTQEADFFPASRFSARFNRPDIVQLVLKTHDEVAAVDQANEKAKRKQDTAPIETTLPPVIKIVSPTAEGKFSGDTVEVMFTVRSPSRLPIDRVDALIDGRPVEARGVAPAASQTADSSGETRQLTIPAPAHDFELALIAHSGTLAGEAARVRLVYAGAPTTAAAVLKSKLYAVTIGVSDYADPLLRLGYAADDARGFAEVLQKQKGGLYGDVEVKTLVDGAATRASVVEALEWLEEQVTSRDFGVVLIACHGVTDEKQRYWFLPADASLQHLRTSAVSQDDIERTMGALAGKAILFLDTCHANAAVAPGGVAGRGPVDMNSLVNEFAKTENGVVTFASSQGRETSVESAAWGHGAFTKALIEGLGEGKADLLHNGTITVSELDAFIAERVKALTEGRQHPVMSRPNTIPDFAFAVVK